MATDPNMLHLLAVDPGGTIGWARFAVDRHAFSRPENKVMANLRHWDCGELSGTEHEQLVCLVGIMQQMMYGAMPYTPDTQVVAEDFELSQLIGGANLLSPVRINAVLHWEAVRLGAKFHTQKRSMRTGITRERLRLFGFTRKSYRKDEFAAMQHGVTWLRRLKIASTRVPWKMHDGMSHNAHWDCACRTNRKCDLIHP